MITPTKLNHSIKGWNFIWISFYIRKWKSKLTGHDVLIPNSDQTEAPHHKSAMTSHSVTIGPPIRGHPKDLALLSTWHLETVTR